MDHLKPLTPFLTVAPQLKEADVGILAARGYRTLINNRPDGESDDQPGGAHIAEAACRLGLDYRFQPVVSGRVTDEDVAAFADIIGSVRGPVVAYCRTGTRCATLWALAEAHHLDPEAILRTAAQAGYDLSALRPRLDARWQAGQTAAPPTAAVEMVHARTYDVVVVGGGAAGCSTAASLLKRRRDLSVAIVEPRDRHYYQPGWTLVGANCFDRNRTERPMSGCIPKGAQWIRAAAAGFEPDRNVVVLEDGERLAYRTLVVCPGIKLDWDRIEGLTETLGRNHVTSNYLFDMAPYTWELVSTLRGGSALFTQPPMPIKCAGAPQKAMYLSCDHWRRRGVLKDIRVDFNTAGVVLFGVETFVPPLTRYVERYGAKLTFQSNLKVVDGPARKAWFEVTSSDGTTRTEEKSFDFLHVVPPQTAPDVVRTSPLADAAGWVEVDPETLQHTRYGNIFGVGDACSAPNAKTAAAVRKQVPVVAENVLSVLDGKGPRALYDGYGSCPLIVEKGRVVMAEFGYGGKLLPTVPLDPTVPRRSAWYFKTTMLPYVYWDLMMKGHEWLAAPKRLDHEPVAHEAEAACNFEGTARRA
jgi:sulfide:quinone oxidoreductase